MDSIKAPVVHLGAQPNRTALWGRGTRSQEGQLNFVFAVSFLLDLPITWTAPTYFMATASRTTELCDQFAEHCEELYSNNPRWDMKLKSLFIYFFNVVFDRYFTSLVRPETHSHQVTIAHNRMQPLPLPRVHCWGPTLLKLFTSVIDMNAALIHIPEPPSPRDTPCQLRSGLQGRVLHNCSGLKLTSVQQQVEDKRKAFVFRCEERFAMIYCQDSTPEVEYDKHKFSESDMGFSI